MKKYYLLMTYHIHLILQISYGQFTTTRNINLYKNQSIIYQETVNGDSHKMYSKGDVILAGLFTIHFHVRNNNHPDERPEIHKCHGEFNRRGFQMVQAMKLAIKEINDKEHVLPGVKIGYDIRDTCQTVESAIRAALSYSFVKKHFNDDENDCGGNGIPFGEQVYDETVAVIGPDTSDLARAMADFCGLFQVPVISPSATSQLLDDDDRFRFFFRTVPSDKYQVQVFLNFIQHFKWNYVILLVSDDEYGRSARLEFTKLIKLEKLTLCLVIDELLNKNNENEIIDKLKNEKKAKVILMISNLRDAKDFIDLLFVRNITGFTMIGSDAWTKNVFAIEGKSSIFRGLFGVSPKETYTNGFQRGLVNAIKEESTHHWVHEFIETEVNKTCKGINITSCILAKDYDLAPYQIVSTFDAVYGIAHALHEILECDTQRCKQNVKNVTWKNLVYYLQNITFPSMNNETVHFNKAENFKGVVYKIWNLKKDEKFSLVGEWNNEGLKFNGNNIFWNSEHNEVPKSVCSAPCPKGTHKHLSNNNAVCCWSCINCTGNTYTNITNTQTCRRCPVNHWPNNDHTGCRPIAYHYLKFGDIWGVVITCCAFLANLVLFATLIVFLVYRNTPVIRASNRGLYNIVLLGNCMLFILPFIVIGKSTVLRCKIVLYGIGVTLSVNVGTLLVKTNRIARIFSRKLFRKRKLRWLSLKSQYAMIFCVICIEIFICLIWELLLGDARLKFVENFANDIRFMKCDYGPKMLGFALWGTYNAGLIIICTYQAFLVRKVPTNYNEAKFIAFTMITICISIMGYIPVYFGTSGYYQDVVISFLFLFTGTVQYISLFVPKVYVVIFRPDKNVSMRQQSTSPRTSFDARASAFESDTDYIPTQREIESLKIGSIKRKRKYGFRKKRKASHVIENNSAVTNENKPKTYLPLAIKSFTKHFDVFSPTSRPDNGHTEKQNGEINQQEK